VMVFISSLCGLVYWKKSKIDLLLLLVNLFNFVMLTINFSFPSAIPTLMPALQSYWLPWHVLTNFLAYACFGVAGAAGVALLISKAAATQTACAQIIDRAIGIGFPLFSIAVLLGALWAAEAWGGYWSWDPKETWALITWLVYLGYMHSRHLRNFTPQHRAYWAVGGFIVTLICYLGVNMFMDGLHSYGKVGA